MNEIYYITRLDSLRIFMVVCLAVGIFGLMVSLSCYIEALTMKDGHFKKASKKWLITSILVLIISELSLVFVPTTKDALFIYGFGGTIDYIKGNDTSKGLPDKAAKALDKYLDELLQDEQNGKDSLRRKTF